MIESLKNTKWATFIFWNFLNPVFYRHHQYYRKKVVIDRFLERKGFLFTAGIGVLFGGAFYLSIVSFLPGDGVPDGSTLEQNASAVMKAMGVESTKEFPVFALLKVKSDIMSRLHASMDRMDVKKQRDEVDRMKREIAELKLVGASQKVVSNNSAGGESSLKS